MDVLILAITIGFFVGSGFYLLAGERLGTAK